MIMDSEYEYILIGGTVLLGLLFGVCVQRSRFCMTAAIANIVLMRDYRQLHAYFAALTTALIGTQILEGFNVVDIAGSIYRANTLDWVGSCLGGLLFGIGAVFAGGCVGRILVRTGEGNLGALLALATLALGAVVAYVGVLEPFRAWMIASTAIELNTGDSSLAMVLGIPQWLLAMGLVSVLICILVTALIRQNVNGFFILAGVLIGAIVVGGWWLTGYLTQDTFNINKPYSLSFSGPVARAAIYLAENKTNGSFYSIALVFSVLTGAFLSAVISRSFKFISPETTSIGRTLLGGFLMGIGAIFAGGCNIGQGLSGMSTLATESMMAFSMILAGMYVGVKWLQHVEETGSYWFNFQWSHGSLQRLIRRPVM